MSSYGDPAAVTNYSYDVADELTSAATPKGTIDYGYDKAGNQTSTTPYAGYDGTVAASRTFARPITCRPRPCPRARPSPPPMTPRATGWRTSWPTYTTSQTWDTNGSLPALATRTDTAGTSDYRYTPNGWGQSVGSGNGTDAYLLTDSLGSVTDATDSVGAARGSGPTDYDPFGASPVDPSTLGSGLLGFAGREIGPDGTYDNQARTYDPSTGSFTGQDPASDPTVDPFVSAYIYANDSPLSQTDPSGRAPQPGNLGVVGSYQPGNDSYHNYALGMAYKQEVSHYGAGNVYADLAGYYGWVGRRWELVGAGIKAGADGYPDLVARDAPLTTGGTGYAVWDVKPATDYGTDSKSTAQLSNYMTGIELETEGSGAAVGPGMPVAPEPGLYDPRTVITIFSSDYWKSFTDDNFRAPTTLGDNNLDGIIFYTAYKFRDRKQMKPGSVYIPDLATGIQQRLDRVAVCTAQVDVALGPDRSGGAAHGSTSAWPWAAVGTAAGGPRRRGPGSGGSRSSPGPIDSTDPLPIDGFDPLPAENAAGDTETVGGWSIETLLAEFPELELVAAL